MGLFSWTSKTRPIETVSPAPVGKRMAVLQPIENMSSLGTDDPIGSSVDQELKSLAGKALHYFQQSVIDLLPRLIDVSGCHMSPILRPPLLV